MATDICIKLRGSVKTPEAARNRAFKISMEKLREGDPLAAVAVQNYVYDTFGIGLTEKQKERFRINLFRIRRTAA